MLSIFINLTLLLFTAKDLIIVGLMLLAEE